MAIIFNYVIFRSHHCHNYNLIRTEKIHPAQPKALICEFIIIIYYILLHLIVEKICVCID